MSHDHRDIPDQVREQTTDHVLGEAVQGVIDDQLAFELELAAAAGAVALLGDDEASVSMPAELAGKVRSRLADPTLRATPTSVEVEAKPQAKGNAPLARLGWLVAAAALLLAAFAWLTPTTRGPQNGAAIYASLAGASSTARADWSTWPQNMEDAESVPVPYAGEVSGEVLWSETEQTGVMVFEGLPANDASAEQYQLWIIVPDQAHPIDGGVFDVPATASGKVYVPIDPKLDVQGAQAFAITIEKPGGVVVSDQRRRVVVAAPS